MDKEGQIPENLWEIAQTQITNDRTGEKFLEKSLPLYDNDFNDKDFRIRETAAANFIGLSPFVGFDSNGISQTPEEIWETMKNIPMPSDPGSVNTLTMLALLLLSEENLAEHKDPAQVWEIVSRILKILSGLQEGLLATELSSRLVEVLSRKGDRMDEKIIQQTYQDYFKTNELPRQHSGPKDLLGQII
ncbi:MAG: hypothetical protein ABII74_04975 [Elusimicrobiota bacterium]